MIRRPLLYPALAGWEIIRLIALVGLLAYASVGVLFPGGEIIAFSFLLGGGNLLIPFGALYLFFSGVSSRSLRLTLAAGKVLGLLSGIVAGSTVLLEFMHRTADEAASTAHTSIFEASLLAVIFLIDLLFLSLLLSFNEKAENTLSFVPPVDP